MKTINELISFLETCENQKQLQVETHTILKLCKEIQAEQLALCNVINRRELFIKFCDALFEQKGTQITNVQVDFLMKKFNL